MDPFTIAALGGMALSGMQGLSSQRKANQMNQRALDQAEYDYTMRAPMRRQGMQALGAVEGAMDLGTIGFNSANPFAAARGPAQSTAKIGNWDRFQTDPDQIDMALSGVRPDELAWAQDALTARRPNGSFVYKGSERNHAQKEIMDKVNRNLGFAGITPQTLMQRNGIQPLNGAAEDAARNPGRFGWGGTPTGRNATRRGVQPLGG